MTELERRYYDELYHHGIKGMKWGVRRYQDKNGQLTSAGRKRYINDKTKSIQKDIDSLIPHRKSGIVAKNGKTIMSTKEIDEIVKGLEQEKSKVAAKAGEKYDKAVRKAETKAAKKQFREDVKSYKKKGIEADYEIDLKTGGLTVTQFYNSRGQKIGQDYAQRVMKKGNSEKAVSTLVGTTAVLAGLSVVELMLTSS